MTDKTQQKSIVYKHSEQKEPGNKKEVTDLGNKNISINKDLDNTLLYADIVKSDTHKKKVTFVDIGMAHNNSNANNEIDEDKYTVVSRKKRSSSGGKVIHGTAPNLSLKGAIKYAHLHICI